MAGVAGRLLEEVRQDPAQGEVAAVVGNHADFVQRGGSGDDGIDIGPGVPIRSQCSIDGVVR